MYDVPERNPFPVYDPFGKVKHWKWRDETGQACEKVYQSQEGALHDLLKYIKYLNHGPTVAQRLWWPIRYTLWPKIVEFLKS